jgi:glycosyltransferase involved in cell wall biosynthesis
MAALLAEGASTAVYLDPDIRIFAPLDAALAPLEQGAEGLLTPHVLHPLPRDGRKPNDHELLMAGVFNLGFLALNDTPSARDLLKWWAGWLRTHCFEDKGTGTFTDQKWLNFGPVFWPGVHILRDDTCNVAYWNLSERRLTMRDGGWEVNGRPLTFFHFSGFNPDDPRTLSKHQDRVGVTSGSPLAKLLAQYAERLFANGHGEWRRVAQAPMTFDNGVPWDDLCRALYRETVEQEMPFRQPLATGKGSFHAWLLEPVNGVKPGSGRRTLSRYLHAGYRRRPDLLRAFPDLFGSDFEHFQAWLENGGFAALGANPALCALPAAESAVPSRDWSAVNYVGYLRSELGLGEAARGNIRALEHHGMPVALFDVSVLSQSERNDWRAGDMGPLPSTPPHAVNIVHVNADQLMLLRERLGPTFFPGRYNIGVWAWETPRFPAAWMDRFALLDEIWVGGRFMYDAIASVSPVPVVHIPHVVAVPQVRADKASFGLEPQETVFLFMFDFFSTLARKNPHGTIEAFRRAFHPTEPVRLVMKSMNGAKQPELLASLRAAAEGLKVTFMDKALDGERRHALLASCDAFVSLHRAEGFGLGIAEAMAHGKPAIATAWSGNTDFADITNSFPVRYSLRALEADDPPYEAGTEWAEPDLDHAAELMRSVWKRPEAARALGERARQHMASHHSPERVGRMMRERLEILRGFDVAPEVLPEPAEVEAQGGAMAFARPALRGTWRRVRNLAPLSWDRKLVRVASAMKRGLGYRD